MTRISQVLTARFTPTAGNYFGRLTKDAIVEALRDARNGAIAPAWLKAKKSDLAAIAEREVADTGWRHCAAPPEAASSREAVSS